MDNFSIKEVLDYYQPDTASLAKQLFPVAKHPKAAFDRILRGETSLSMEQLEVIANFLGVFVSDLISPSSWKGISEQGSLVFIKGPYKARINYDNSFLSIYSASDNNLISQHVINPKILTIDELVCYLDNITSNLKQTKKNGKN